MTIARRNIPRLVRTNMAYARKCWPSECSKSTLSTLRELTTRFFLSIPLGELRFLDGTLYVTHSGLLRVAERRHCRGIRVQLVASPSCPSTGRWVFKATVYKTNGAKGFVGYGDADPSNVSPLVRGAEMRVAETRAVNRALRKAYGIGLCSVEELGWSPRGSDLDQAKQAPTASNGNNHQHSGQPRLRDRLCLLIRQHQLDPNLVKAYAADYCGTTTLREASRDLVEAFINEIAGRASKDREGLVCHLNSYAKPQEVNS